MKRGVGKRGLSDVVTTIIIIGISIIAIGIVWAVISSIISGSSNQVNIDKLTVKLDVTSAVMTQNGLEVSVKRDPGTGNISNLALVVSDGLRKETFLLNQTIGELQEKKFTLNYFGIIRSVDIVPFFSGQSGTIISGDIADTLKFGPSQTIKNIPGLVSWYRMEGNANDEMGLNDGELMLDSNYAGYPTITKGRFGQAYKFTNAGERIEIQDSLSLQLENSNMSLIVWVNETTSGLLGPIFTKGDSISNVETGYQLWMQREVATLKMVFGTDKFKDIRMGNLTLKKWQHLVGTQNIKDGTVNLKFYINNINTKQASGTFVSTSSLNIKASIGSDIAEGFNFPGIIDEVMIFNRTLSDEEIAGLYALDLS